MLKNKIKILINPNNQLTFGTESPINFEELLQITQTIVLGQARSVVDRAPKDQKTEAKETLYDVMNQAFSRTLEFFAPEFELRPGLTAQAILEAENKLIERKAKK